MPKLVNVDVMRRRVRMILEESLSRTLLTSKDGISFAELAKLKRFHHYVSLHAQYVYGFRIRKTGNEMLVTSSDMAAVRNFSISINNVSFKECEEYVIDLDQTIKSFVHSCSIFRIGVNTNNEMAIFLCREN